MDRRDFIKTIGVAGGSVLVARTAKADESVDKKEFVGVLVDTTRCVGCRICEVACAEANNLPVPNLDDDTVYDRKRKTSEDQFSVVNYYNTEHGMISVKNQCMHCNQPACVSACLTNAMYKTEEGPVIWREDKCMGCRYCMVSCPFDVPKFEYNSAVPRIRKCNMCWARLQDGAQPACVEACPAEALLLGTRRELVEIARSRIYAEPDKYVHHIYGEYEAGGTGVLYLSSVSFEQLGFKTDLEKTPYPELTRDFLYGVPIVLTLWPAFLLALSKATQREEQEPTSEV
jgi:Fe-S-cluster-containing dehydrogenase component